MSVTGLKYQCLSLLLITVATVLLSSCSVVLESSKISALRNDYCAPSMVYQQDTLTVPADSVYHAVASRLSAHDYTLANHIGLVPLISRYLQCNQATEQLAARQKIIDKILLFNAEVEAVVAELDCNGERYDQLARFLENKNGKTTTQLTVASIVTGAAVTISTAFIKNDQVNKAVNISGGIAGAGLGFMLLNPKGKKVKMQIHRNLLNNVWTENNADSAFPPALWRVMNERAFSNEGKLSLVQTLKKRWLLFVFDDKVDKQDEQKFFGKGGYFSEEDIQHLADMHNQLQASVRTVQQDMRSLLISMNHL